MMTHIQQTYIFLSLTLHVRKSLHFLLLKQVRFWENTVREREREGTGKRVSGSGKGGR